MPRDPDGSGGGGDSASGSDDETAVDQACRHLWWSRTPLRPTELVEEAPSSGRHGSCCDSSSSSSNCANCAALTTFPMASAAMMATATAAMACGGAGAGRRGRCAAVGSTTEVAPGGFSALCAPPSGVARPPPTTTRFEAARATRRCSVAPRTSTGRRLMMTYARTTVTLLGARATRQASATTRRRATRTAAFRDVSSRSVGGLRMTTMIQATRQRSCGDLVWSSRRAF